MNRKGIVPDTSIGQGFYTDIDFRCAGFMFNQHKSPDRNAELDQDELSTFYKALT
ncbi:hypothetical protein AB2B38_004770 [Balneola sp. MJW-20]|uniref:hypothetical protein n=1 Tax=Gracilimonas aurantiaca TaxID=3234185 RepID=UPI00390A71E3